MRSSPRRILPFLLAMAAAATLAAPVVAQEEPEPDAPATALRVAIDRALGEHAFLLGEVVRSGIANGPDFDAAAAALEENSADVIGAIEDVYGAAAGEAFGEQWRNHVAYIVDYGRALGDGDADAAQLASDQLDRYVTDFSGFLADALPALPPDAVEGLIGEHVRQLEHVASLDMADFGGAYGAIRETYEHMFAVGDGLAIGIVSRYPDRFTGRVVAFSPATDLRVTLDRLLGEYSYLSALATRAVLRGASDDAQSAADAVAANSEGLRATIAEVYGSEVGDAFAGLWGSHVATYFAYVDAVANGDEAAADTAIAQLRTHQMDVSAYVAEANPFLSSDALESLLAEHTEHLIAQADAYAAGDYDAAFALGREAYAQTGELSTTLAGAIADQFPQRFPDAAVPQPTAPIGLLGVGLLAASVVLAAAVAARASSRISGRPGPTDG